MDSDNNLDEPLGDLTTVGPFFMVRACSTCPHGVNPPCLVDYSSDKTKVIRGIRYDTTHEPAREPFVSDARFFTMFHIDYYNSVILNDKKANLILNQKFIDWEASRRINDPDLNHALAPLDHANLRGVMTFRYD